MSLRIVVLTFLYFIQGLPYGFQDKVVPIYLRGQGLSYTELSFTKLLHIPWFCKAFFSPLIDNCLSHSTWLHLSLNVLGVVSAITGYFLCHSFGGLILALFLLNTFTAIQDISVDALALNILREQELGFGNTGQVVGFKLGAIFGGGILFWIQIKYGLGSLFYALAVAYFSASFIFKWVEITSNINSGIDGKIIKTTNLTFSHVFSCFTGLFTSETLSIAMFVLLYKLGEVGIITTFPVYLIDQGVAKETIVFWNNFIGQIASLCGSAFGGFLIRDSKVTFTVLKEYCYIRLFPVAAHFVLIVLWSLQLGYWFSSLLTCLSISALIALQFSGGIISTATFSIMMVSSQSEPDNMKSTHHSCLASLEVFGKLMFASFVGAALDLFGFIRVYFFMLILTIIPIFAVPEISIKQKDLELKTL